MFADLQWTVFDEQPKTWNGLKAWWMRQFAPHPSMPYVGPGYRGQLTAWFSHHVLPTPPVRRDCSAMRPMNGAGQAPLPPSADVPWLLFRPKTRVGATVVKAPVAVAMSESEALVASTVAEIMKRLINALENEATARAIEVTEARPADPTILAKRLAVVAKLNKPQRAEPKHRHSTALAKAADGSGRPALITGRSRVIVKARSGPQSKSVDMLVAAATSNVVRFTPATKPHSRDIRRYGLAA